MKTNRIFNQVIKNQLIFVAAFLLFVVAFYFLAIFKIPNNENTFFGQWYWLFAGVLLFLSIVYSVYAILKAKHNKYCFAVNVADKMIKYGYLLKQLVKRDFKTKYKRSFLGIIWSFLHPLLMMGTQYLVFSTLFGNDNIKCYPVYLLIGVIMFNFATESANTGLVSITSNANLINKVYVPKYIYTISKVISALINFALSLIPLIIIMLCLQIWPSPYHILIIFDFFLLYIFVLGLAMLLASIMVFFRDMQFIWGVVSLAWMYATPIFYSINNFKDRKIGIIIKCNPMYHYLTAARTILIDCTSPDLFTYLWCIICSVGMFAIGAIVFKKTQDKFVLYV